MSGSGQFTRFKICIHQSAPTLATVPYHFTRFKICLHQSALTLATVPYHFTRFKICLHQSAPTLALCHTTLHVSKFVFIRVRPHLHCAIPLYTFQNLSSSECAHTCTVPYHFTRFKFAFIRVRSHLPLCHTTLHVSKFVLIRVCSHLPL